MAVQMMLMLDGNFQWPFVLYSYCLMHSCIGTLMSNFVMLNISSMFAGIRS